jgi:hypothetical protein
MSKPAEYAQVRSDASHIYLSLYAITAYPKHSLLQTINISLPLIPCLLKPGVVKSNNDGDSFERWGTLKVRTNAENDAGSGVVGIQEF